MRDEMKTKERLIDELVALRQRVAEYEAAELEYKHEEEKLHFIRCSLDRAAVAAVWMGPDARLLYVNDAACRSLDYSREELLSMTVHDIDPNFPPAAWPAHWREIKGRGSFSFESRHRTKSGRTFPVDITAHFLQFKGKEYYFALAQDITERRLAEAALRESESRFRNVTENSLTAIVIHQQGKLVYVNPRAAELLGYERAELEGFEYADLVHPGDRAELLSFARAREREEDVPARHEWRFLTKEGKTLWADVLAARTVHEGRPAVFVNAVDITEHKRTDEALQESERRYRDILEGIEEGYFEVDLAGNFTFVNTSLCKTFQRSREELLGMNNREYTSPETARKMYRIFNKIHRTGEPATVTDHEIIRSDGSVRVLELSASLMIDTSGQPTGFRGVSRDVTDRKRAEAALRESEEKFRTVTEGSLTAIVVYQEGKLVYFNPAATELVGYEAAEMEGTDITTFVRPEDRAEIISLARARERGEDVPPRHEWQLVTKDGRIVWVELLAARTVYQGCPAVFLNAVDITDRKRMEEEIIRTRKLESLSVLAGGIAHDFNNMLTSILGNISFAKQLVDPDDSKLLRRLVEAEKASLKARDLTQQLLTFSRGGAPIKETVSLVELLKGTVSFAMSGSNVLCEFSILDDMWPVDADQGQISQVIENLIINACQAMPEGGTIRVRAENITLGRGDVVCLDEGRYVRVSITDQGIGIPPGHLSRIFDPYFTTKQEGRGLGLGTSYSIIKKHGGHIAVESELGVGTTFYVYLPASEKPVLPREDEEEGYPVGEGRILVMDDEESVRSIAADILTHMGYEVEFAKDGGEAIESYERAKDAGQPFDAVIMDLTVPGGMGGKDAIQKLLKADPEAKVIVSSGYSKDAVMSQYREYGFKSVIAKPYKIQELGRVVRNVIEGTTE